MRIRVVPSQTAGSRYQPETLKAEGRFWRVERPRDRSRGSQVSGASARRLRGKYALLATLMTAAWVHEVYAADPAPVNPPTAEMLVPPEGIQELTITAQKRKEAQKDVPISMTALSANALEAAHIENYDDMSREVPGLGFGSGGYGVGTGQMNVELRGVSSITGAATVGLYIDDISVTTKNFYDGNTQPLLFDLDRIEVVRGPQGTLYGASSEGGTIRFITSQPKMNTFSASESADMTTQVRGGIGFGDSAMINIPIIPDQLAVRASVAYDYQPGWIDNLTETGQLKNKGVNTEKDMVAHFSALYEPTDDWTIKAAIFAQQNKMGDSPAFFDGGALVPPFYPAQGMWNQDKFIQESDTDRVVVPSLNIEKDFKFGSLTSVTGLFLRDIDRYQDGTLYNSYAFATLFIDPALSTVPGPLTPDPNNDTLIGAIPSPIRLSSSYETFSQEFRVTSKSMEESGLPFTWVFGVYGAYQKVRDKVNQHIPGVNAEFQKLYGIPIEDSTQLATYVGVSVPFEFFPQDVDEWQEQHYEEKSISGFGQVDYHITKDLHVSAGLRYEVAKFNFWSQEYGFYEIGDLGNPAPFTEEQTDFSMTPKFTITYDLSKDSNVYASAGKGVRYGGPTGPLPSSVCTPDLAVLGLTEAPTKFNTDSLWSYELGSKNRLLGNKLSIDGAVYYIKWSNMQQQYWLPTCGYPVELNVGDAESTGGELEIHYKPIQGLTFGLSSSIDYTKVTSTINPAAAQVGERILNTPRYTMDISGEYAIPLWADKVGYVRADYSYIGSSSATFVKAYPDYSDPAYGVLNASLGVNWSNWELSLYGKNLNNDKSTISKPEVNTMFEGYTVHPLTVGFLAKYKYN